MHNGEKMMKNNFVGGGELLKSFEKYLSDEDVVEIALSLKISDAVTKRRKELGLSQSDLAIKLGVTQPVVSKWESGDTNYTIRTIVDIFCALEIEFEFLIGNEVQSYFIDNTFVNNWKRQPMNFDSNALQLLTKGA